MKIADVLKTKDTAAAVVTIAPERTVADLLALLAEHRIGAVVVSRDGERVEGIVSERDVVRRLHEQGATVLERPVAEIATTQVRTCGRDEDVSALAATMTEHRIRHVPVVQDGRLVAIVSIGDVVKHRIRDLAAERDQLEAYITH